jgi:hypothetical protein
VHPVQPAPVDSGANPTGFASMDIFGILVLIVCVWLFFKVVGGLFKAAVVVVALAIIWYLVAPMLGMPRPF